MIVFVVRMSSREDAAAGPATTPAPAAALSTPLHAAAHHPACPARPGPNKAHHRGGLGSPKRPVDIMLRASGGGGGGGIRAVR